MGILSPWVKVATVSSTSQDAEEYAELPVRHNEDQMNSELAKHVPIEVNPHSFDSSHTKAHLLMQAHFAHAMLPCPDYVTDTKTVLDQSVRICQAMLDVAANQGWLVTALNITSLIQMLIQGRWIDESSLLTLPNIENHHLHLFRKWNQGNRKVSYQGPIECLPELIAACDGKESIFASIMDHELHTAQIAQAWHFLSHLPVIEVNLMIRGCLDDAVKEQNELPVPMLATGMRDDKKWIKLHSDQEYVLQVQLQRLHFGYTRTKTDSKALAPRFPKAKDEGWFLILGEVDKKELVALKRIGYVRNQSVASIAFYTPEAPGKYIYTLYLMSDSYLGMDQQYDIYLNILPATTSTQVNIEISDAFNDLALK